MKKMICLLLLIIAAGTVKAHEECEVELRPLRGIYRTYCPAGTVVTGNGTRVSHIGNSIFVDDQLKCAELKIVCNHPAKKIDTDPDLD